jgi:phospholipid/cholesterol/gamma-HCH transport system substrate-binding protein
MRSDQARALRVGILAILSVAILVTILVVTGPLGIVRGDTVDVDFSFAGPIKPGASVRISGVVVGAVQSVDLLAGQPPAAPDKMVRVRAKIEERAMPVVTDRAVFRVTTLGILGEHYLDIEPVAGGTRLKDGARVDGWSGARPDLLLSSAAGLLAKADQLLPSSPEARALMDSAAQLMKRIDALLDKGGDVDADVHALTADLRTLIHGAAVGVGDGKSLRATLDKLPPTLDDVDKAELPALAADVRTTLAATRSALALVERQPLADPAKQEQLRADLEHTLQALDQVSRRADRLLGVVEERKGAAGKLFWDDEAADDLKAVLKGLRQNPVRFFLGSSPEK